MVNERLLIQCNWDQVYREGAGKFWISYKCVGQQSVHSYVLCESTIDGDLRLETEDSVFNIDNHSRNQIKLTYNDGHISLSTVFRAAAKEYSLHGKNKKVNCLDVTDGGLGLSCAESSTTIKIWETGSGSVRRELSGHVGDIYRAKFFPSGVVVLSGGADTQLKIWSAETGQCAATMVGHKAGVSDFEFVEKGRNVVSCSRDGTAKLWDVSQQQCIHTYATESGLGVINSCSLHSTQLERICDDQPSQQDSLPSEVGTEGKLLLLASENGRVQGFGLHTKSEIFEVVSPDSSAVNCVKFTSEDSFVIGTEDGTVAVYDLRNLSNVRKSWKEARSKIQDLESYQQGFLYSSGDGSVVYVDETLTQACELSGADCDAVYQVAHTNNEIYASCRDGNIRVYTVNHS